MPSGRRTLSPTRPSSSVPAGELTGAAPWPLGGGATGADSARCRVPRPRSPAIGSQWVVGRGAPARPPFESCPCSRPDGLEDAAVAGAAAEVAGEGLADLVVGR